MVLRFKDSKFQKCKVSKIERAGRSKKKEFSFKNAKISTFCSEETKISRIPNKSEDLKIQRS